MIASDHGGWELKEHIKRAFPQIQWTDWGTTDQATSVDYPDLADALCAHLTGDREGRAGIEEAFEPQGILICGSGQGMAMRANKYPGVRAALVWSEETARLAREHNAANVLCLGGRVLDPLLAEKCVRIFLETPFAGGRHARRVEKVMATNYLIPADGKKKE